MATFNTYQQPSAQTPLARKWFVIALIASLLLHAVMFVAFRETKLKHFTTTTYRLVPRNFGLSRVAVNEKALDEPEQKQSDHQDTTPPVPNVAVPDEKPTADANPQDVIFKPTTPDVVKTIATENPKVADADLSNLAKMQQSASKELDNEINKVSEQLIKDKTQTSSKSLLKFSDNTTTGGGKPAAGGGSAIPGTKSLDEALSSTGGDLQNGDKIGIRGGALFDEDSDVLRPDAMNDLKKLAAVVKRYPAATFTIEGYADSYGTPEHNLDLSQRRANTVMSWLLLTAGINPSRIAAKGYGSTKFIVFPFVISPNATARERALVETLQNALKSGAAVAGPGVAELISDIHNELDATGTGKDEVTVDEQEKNRRVEIGIKFPH